MDEEITGRAKGGKIRAEKLSDEEKREIAKKGAAARWAKDKESATQIVKENNVLTAISLPKSATPGQGTLDLGIKKLVEIDGVGMGVLSDGTAFLTGRGLARICGIHHKQIQNITDEWIGTPKTPRVTKIMDILAAHNSTIDSPIVALRQRSGTFIAYPDIICLAVLEYYAFDAGTNVKEQAKKNYRLLAGHALRDFIYTQVGYDPNNSVPDPWKQFHDRVSLTYNSVPKGYFGIFKEMADMIVTLGQSGIYLDDKFVPDISVGVHWAKYWKDNNLEQKYGLSDTYDHCYPDYFPQSESNPQDCRCYPENALGEFRKWLREIYIGEGKFKNYLDGKIKQKQLPASFSQLAIAAYGIKDE